MDFLTHIREALSNLFTSKLRSFLAILGVLVGTGSVVALISSSQLATAHALAQFKALGTNLLAMTIQDDPRQRKTAQKTQLQLKNIPQIKKASDQIVEAAPYTTVYQSLNFEGKSMGGQVLGATGALAEIAKISMARGRFVSYLDRHNFYCVIGDTVAKTIEKRGVDPLYQQIQLGKKFFTIIGIANKWQPNLFIYANINKGVIIPLQASYVLSKEANINNVLFRLVSKPDIKLVQQQIKKKLKQILPNKEINFRNPEQIIKIVAKQRVTFTWLLGAIGSISLLVGGIGVMNIMLVSVVERRREIGVRMAIGARGSDILTMFLIESIILTVFGGILGIIAGIGVSFILAFVTKWEFHLFLLPPILGFVVSLIVGILSGFYPALRASRLDPIKTLQSE